MNIVNTRDFSPGFNAELIQVIRTNLDLRGDGVTMPYRRVTQYWSNDGQLLAEVDPVDEKGKIVP